MIKTSKIKIFFHKRRNTEEIIDCMAPSKHDLNNLLLN